MRVLPYGDRALLVELADTAAAVAWARGLAEVPPEGAGRLVAETVPAARTVLVVACDDVSMSRVREVVEAVAPRPAGGSHAGSDDGSAGEVVEVPVVYDGEDLDAVAAHTGLGVDEVVAAHTGQTWTVAFGGFAPGFGYLVGEDERLRVPRREESRTRVPAGSVGLAGEFSGIYPRSSPGGWQLLGRTDVTLFDPDRSPAALLRPGVRVRFVHAGGHGG